MSNNPGLNIRNTLNVRQKITIFWQQQTQLLGPYYIGPGDAEFFPLDLGTYNVTVYSGDGGNDYTLTGIEIEEDPPEPDLVINTGPVLQYA